MVKRIAAALMAAVLLLPAAALAALKWSEETPGLVLLKEYTENVNEILTEAGESPVNTLFSNFPAETVMGITLEDDAEIPDSVEITVELTYESLRILELRVSEIDRFPVIAAAFIKALYGEGMSWEDALRIPKERAKRAAEDPGNSFEEPVEEMNGTIPRTYYAYFPDQYRNGVNWMQMTLVFPMAGSWDGKGLILGTEDEGIVDLLPEEEANPDYDGFFSSDDYSHLEVFTTATPEPDSAAAEYDFR
jgi:hypothetical protein